MVVVEGYNFPDELYYSDRHMWARKERDGSVTLGIDDMGQKLVGKIMFIRLPKEGLSLTPGKDFATIESMKWVERLKSPVTGVVKEANARLRIRPVLVSEDPYGTAWLVKIQPSGNVDEELSKLAHGSAIEAWARKEFEERVKKGKKT